MKRFCLYEIHLTGGDMVKWGISSWERSNKINTVLSRVGDVIPLGKRINKQKTRIYVYDIEKYNRMLEKNIHTRFEEYNITDIGDKTSGRTEWFQDNITLEIRAFITKWNDINDLTVSIYSYHDFAKFVEPSKELVVGLDYKPKDEKFKMLSIQQMEKIFSICSATRYSQRNYLILVLQFFCGLTISELYKLKTTDLIEADGDIKEQMIISIGDNKSRVVYLSNHLVRQAIQDFMAVRKRIKFTDVLFISQQGKQFGQETMSRVIDKIYKTAGPDFSKFPPRSGRITFIKTLINNGISLKCVQQLAGHESLSSTMRYVKDTKSISMMRIIESMYCD